jgi:protein-arginine kinase activator protein McsA
MKHCPQCQQWKNEEEFSWRYQGLGIRQRVCADCGEYDFSVLNFDHVRGVKKKDITRMMADGDSIAAILAEIAKCDVVCFNCHMRRESKRRSGGRFRKFWPKYPGDERDD